jgi:hypothetical protein
MGKDFGGAIAELIQKSKQDAIANQLMNTDEAPRAALVDPGSQTVTTGDSSGSGPGPTQDLGTLPPDSSTFTNPSTGNVEPLQGQESQDDQLRQAMVAARLSDSTPTVGSLSATSGPTTSRVANVIPAGVSTAGTAPHTGGTMEMELRKAMLAQQLQKAQLAKATAPEPPEDPMVVAQRRATLARTLAETAQIGKDKTKQDKNPPAVNIGSEPVIDQNQLNRHIDGIYGNNAASSMASSINEPQTLPDGTPNPKAPVVSGDSVSVPVGANKNITMPLAEAQTYVKQANAIRLKQGLPAYRVPGEDQSVGATAANPYIAHNNLDVYSRAPGTWIRLPNGKVAQVPPR